MPETFPTFDAVAALGLLVVLLRTIALERMVRSIPRFATRIVELLAKGKHERALALCDQFPTSVYPPVARRLLLLAERLGPLRPVDEVRSRLNDAFDAALAAQERRQHTSRARDVAALGVLGGAVVYLNYSGLGGSNTFLVSCIFGACLLAYGIFARSRLIATSRGQRGALVEACARASQQISPTSNELNRCPTCGAALSAAATSPDGTQADGAALPEAEPEA